MRKLIIVVVISFFTVGCRNTGSPSAANQEQQRLEMEQRQADQAKIEKCAEIAQRIIDASKRDESAPGVAISGTNHYNKTASKCFLDISSFGFQGKTWFKQESLIDAYENKPLISCASTNENPDTWCFVPGIATRDGKSQNLSGADAHARILASMSN